MDKPEGTISLADFTELALITPDLRGQDAAAVIQELGQAMQRAARVPELLPFYHAVLNREYLISTVLDYGIALPHARLTGLKDLCFALGRINNPIQWGPKGAMPVRLVFLLAVPSTEAAEYLHLMAGLTRLGKEPSLLQTLLAAQNAEEMFSLLGQIKIKNCRALTT
jgi:nitrogen PTS system EIIA component